MNSLPSKKYIIATTLFSIIIILLVSVFSFSNNKTKMVFCDVGQGDATYIRIKNSFDVLIDSGPGLKVLDCLGRHMPFYDKTIEIAFVSHPQKDHLSGYLYLFDRYKIKTLIIPDIKEKTAVYSNFEKKVNKLKINTLVGYSPTIITALDSKFTILSPGKINCHQANNCSMVVLFTEGENRVLFTGDVSKEILNSLSKQAINNITILKIPHHGSKYGLSKYFLKLADPVVGVISVGKNNPYEHPAQETLDLLNASHTIIRRTDKEGEIVYKLN